MPTYLSLAFRPRTPEELSFLEGIDGGTGFSLFWIDIVRPLLHEVQARSLLEIGAFEGEHTRLLLDYCETVKGSLTVVEPSVRPGLVKSIEGSTRVRLIQEKSGSALPRIDSPVDAVLLEGDLNYVTVYSDLTHIRDLSGRQRIDFPIVFVRAVSWPYGRRDMYYAPEQMPATERHEYAKKGMTPWSPTLEQGMINSCFANALEEGGARNGVLSAVEDFLRGSDVSLGFLSIPLNHGLGLIWARSSRLDEFIRSNILPPKLLGQLLETCELARLNEVIRRLETPRSRGTLGHAGRKRLADTLRRVGRAVIGMVDR